MRCTTRSILVLALLLAATAVAGCREEVPTTPEPAAAPEGPPAAKHAMAPDGALHIDADDRCPVCAMRPAKTPKFASGIELSDGRTFHTCGTGCLIRSWLHPEVYLGVERAAVKRTIVPEYFEGRPIDATQAHWVAGSDVVGPMGPALVPLGSAAEADTFVERHGSKHRFRLADLDDARWLEITGRPAVPTGGTTK